MLVATAAGWERGTVCVSAQILASRSVIAAETTCAPRLVQAAPPVGASRVPQGQPENGREQAEGDESGPCGIRGAHGALLEHRGTVGGASY